MRKRTRAREIALTVLYQIDLSGEEEGRTPEDRLAGEEAAPDVRAYARGLIDGVLSRREAIDSEIQKAAENWDLGRMPVIDRNVLRIAAYELGWQEDVPPKVAINEGIDLAKKFSTKDSGAFVNGILDRILGRRDQMREAAGPR